MAKPLFYYHLNAGEVKKKAGSTAKQAIGLPILHFSLQLGYKKCSLFAFLNFVHICDSLWWHVAP